MSIASEYAAHMKQTPEFVSSKHTRAWVTSAGGLYLPTGTLTADEALKLAAWIQRTFGPSDGEGK